MSGLELVAVDRTATTRIRDIWTALEARACPSYFLSWGWIETWLAMLPASVDVKLYVVRRGGEPIAAFFLGARSTWRHRVMPTRNLYLNYTGREPYDELCLEYNGLLSTEPVSLGTLVDQLPANWDELHLPALDEPSTAALGAFTHANLVVRIDRRVQSPYIDLARVRSAAGYVRLLGKNTRAAIRKSIRRYAPRGEPMLEVANTLDRALDIFGELVELHRRTWRTRGQDGAFIPFVHAFHDRLIRARFASGEIQLARVRVGDTTLGCLYNFVYNGDVAFYQSGFAYEDDPKLKPGLVCHAEAVRYNAARGHARYDLLAGDSTYKQQLATDNRELVWARVQKPRLRFVVEDFARGVRDLARVARKRQV